MNDLDFAADSRETLSILTTLCGSFLFPLVAPIVLILMFVWITALTLNMFVWLTTTLADTLEWITEEFS